MSALNLFFLCSALLSLLTFVNSVPLEERSGSVCSSGIYGELAPILGQYEIAQLFCTAFYPVSCTSNAKRSFVELETPAAVLERKSQPLRTSSSTSTTSRSTTTTSRSTTTISNSRTSSSTTMTTSKTTTSSYRDPRVSAWSKCQQQPWTIISTLCSCIETPKPCKTSSTSTSSRTASTTTSSTPSLTTTSTSSSTTTTSTTSSTTTTSTTSSTTTTSTTSSTTTTTTTTSSTTTSTTTANTCPYSPVVTDTSYAAIPAGSPGAGGQFLQSEASLYAIDSSQVLAYPAATVLQQCIDACSKTNLCYYYNFYSGQGYPYCVLYPQGTGDYCETGSGDWTAGMLTVPGNAPCASFQGTLDSNNFLVYSGLLYTSQTDADVIQTTSDTTLEDCENSCLNSGPCNYFNFYPGDSNGGYPYCVLLDQGDGGYCLSTSALWQSGQYQAT